MRFLAQFMKHPIFPCTFLEGGAGVSQSVAGYRFDNRATGVWSQAEAKDFSSSLCVQTSSEAHPASYPMGTGGKAQPGREADHSPPSGAEVKNEYELYFLSPLSPAWR
jgi:hypothetical protein